MDNTYYNFVQLLKERSLVVFGCGQIFNRFCIQFPELLEKIDFIIDNSENIQGTFVEVQRGEKNVLIPVKSVDHLNYCTPNSYVVLFCAVKWEEMKAQLDEHLEHKYVSFVFPMEVEYINDSSRAYRDRLVCATLYELKKRNCLMQAIELTGCKSEKCLEEAMLMKEINAMPRLTVVLTSCCSLKCKDCNNLMWAFNKPKELDVNRIIKSLQNILASIDFIGCVEVIGGEPFLAKRLKTVLAFLIKQDKVLSIEITTNAMIIPAETLQTELQNKKVIVRVSNYGNIINQTPFIEAMRGMGVNFEILPMERWTASGGVEKRNRSAKELIRQYYNCTASYMCKTLWEDRIYPCARAASLAQLGIISECPYIDVLRTEKLADKIGAFYTVASCGPCDYCDMAIDEVEYVEPAIQIDRKTN